MPHSIVTIFQQLARRSTPISSGPNQPNFKGGGTYHGRAGVRAYLTQSRASWAEGSSEPERLIVAGHRIIVFVHARVRLKDSAEWRETRLADVFTFRNGKATHMRAFADRREALKWAGLADSDAAN